MYIDNQPITTINTLPTYTYLEYSNDPDIQAFFTSYNTTTQENLDLINGLNPPIYFNQSGAVLNWNALNYYGQVRQSLSVGGPRAFGPVNTFQANQEQPNEFKLIPNSNSYEVSDQEFIRIVQWNTFKGDGFQCTSWWFGRRVMRFLTGDLYPDQYIQVEITYPNAANILITLYPGSASLEYALILQAGIESGVLQTPFEYIVTLEIDS